MDRKETPITKYLANLERRKSLFLGQNSLPSPSSPTPFSSIYSSRQPQTGTQMKINFDDTFFADDNESMLHISPSDHSAAKRRRTSFRFDESDAVEVETLQKKISELERLLRQTQSELIDSRAAYTKLDQISIEHRRQSDEKLISLERSQEDSRIKCKNATERAERMEKELLKLQKKDSETCRNMHAQVTNQLNKISNLEAKVTSLQKENQELVLKLTEENIGHEEKLHKLQAQLDSAESKSAKSSYEAEIAQGQLKELQSQLQKYQSELKEANMEALKINALKKELESQQNTNEASNASAMMQLRKYENLYVQEQVASQEKTKTIQKLTEENGILKTTLKREHLLQAQIMSTESEISVLKKQLRDKDAVEGERNNLRNEVKAWINIATKLDASCRTPISFDSLIRSNQDLMLELKVENSNLKRELENKSRLLISSEAEVVKAKTEIQTISAEVEKLNFDLKKVTRLKNLIVQDRDGLKSLKESYEEEFDGLISEPLKARIAQLESAVAEYEAAMSEDPSFRKPCPDCAESLSKIESLKSQLSGLEEEKADLSRTLAEANIEKTEDPTTGLKIVSFRNNPSMISIEERLRECIAENEKLKEKLQEFQENTVREHDNHDAALRQEKKELEDRLKILERKHELLTESYDYETVQLQNACTKLFGYYVILSRGGGTENPHQFRLQSIYSSAPDETFILQEGTAGEMLLMDTPILAHFQDDIERFLRQECSVPAFLSAVTITYSQGVQFPSTSQVEYEDTTVHEEQETIQVYATESFSTASSSLQNREVQIEVEGEDEEDEEDHQDEHGVAEEDGGETDHEDDYDEEDEVDYDDGRDDEPDDDDVVMID